MPAAKQFSASPFSALAVQAMMTVDGAPSDSAERIAQLRAENAI